MTWAWACASSWLVSAQRHGLRGTRGKGREGVGGQMESQ